MNLSYYYLLLIRDYRPICMTLILIIYISNKSFTFEKQTKLPRFCEVLIILINILNFRCAYNIHYTYIYNTMKVKTFFLLLFFLRKNPFHQAFLVITYYSTILHNSLIDKKKSLI